MPLVANPATAFYVLNTDAGEALGLQPARRNRLAPSVALSLLFKFWHRIPAIEPFLLPAASSDIWPTSQLES